MATKKTTNQTKKTHKDTMINRDIYPEEYHLLSEQERDFLNDFSKNTSEYLYGSKYKILESAILLLSGEKISKILHIKIVGSKDLLNLIIDAIQDIYSPTECKESLTNSMEHITNNSIIAMKIFANSCARLGIIAEASGYDGIRGRFETILEKSIPYRKQHRAEKIGGKTPFKGMDGILEIKKTDDIYSHIKLGTQSIQLTMAGINQVKSSYYESLKSTVKSREEYLKRFNVSLVLCLVLFNGNKFRRGNKNEQIRILSLLDPKVKDNFKRNAKRLKQHINGFDVSEDVGLMTYITYVRKILERCGLFQNVNIKTKASSECVISITS